MEQQEQPIADIRSSMVKDGCRPIGDLGKPDFKVGCWRLDSLSSSLTRRGNDELKLSLRQSGQTVQLELTGYRSRLVTQIFQSLAVPISKISERSRYRVGRDRMSEVI